MKKIIISAVFLFSVISFSQAQAQETISLEPMSAVSTAAKEADSGFIVTGSDKLITQPGALFTQGGDYTGIDLPYLISTPKPLKYPRWALRQGWEGRFSIAIEVRKDGSVGTFKVMQSTGHKILDQAATDAVRSWKFHPAMKNGQPVVECAQIPVTFKISEK